MAKISLKSKPYGVESKPSKPTASYPYLSIDKELPLQGDDVGKTITATVTLKLNSYSERNSVTNQNCSYSFDVLDITLSDKKSIEKAESNAKTNLDKVFKK